MLVKVVASKGSNENIEAESLASWLLSFVVLWYSLIRHNIHIARTNFYPFYCYRYDRSNKIMVMIYYSGCAL